MGQLVYSMNKTLGIGTGDLEGALAATMQGTYAGSFNMNAMARYIPQIAGQMKGLGWTGRGSLDSVVAMLETVSQQSGTPEETATNFKDMLQALTGKYTVKSFKHEGIDLPNEMQVARKAGKNPVDSYLDILERMIKGVDDPVQQAYILGKVLHNQQAGSSARALLQNRAEQRNLADTLHGIGADKLTKDYQTAMAGLEPQLKRLSAEWAVFEMRLGTGFANLVAPTIGVLHEINAALNWMDQRFPGLLSGLLTYGGGLAVLATGLGVLIPLFRAMRAGAMLLAAPWRIAAAAITFFGEALFGVEIAGGPILWVITAIAAAAYLIYENWDKIGPWFRRLWAWIKTLFGEFVDWVSGWAPSAIAAAVEVIKTAWSGLKGFFTGLWDDIKAPFERFMDDVERRVAAAKSAFGMGGPQTGAPPGAAPSANGVPMLGPGGAMPMSYQPRGGQFAYPPLDVNIKWDGPGKVEAPKRLEPVNRGRTVDRA